MNSTSQLDPQQAVSNSNHVVNLKIMVPSMASGAIIGKGGETIAEIQRQTGTRIKISKANDFYPGTNERVCLIQGNAESVLIVMDFIADKIHDRTDPTKAGMMMTTPAAAPTDFDRSEREKQIKVIIPNSTAGMVIGKGGSFIKLLKDESGAFIQISQKSRDACLPERILTIIGDRSTNRTALEMILAKVQEDPQGNSCLNISYGDVQLQQQDHRPQQQQQQQHQQQQHQQQQQQQQQQQHLSPFVLPMGNGRYLDLKFNTHPGWQTTDPSMMAQCLQHVTVTLRSQGFAENSLEEIAKSMSCLASHGILTFGIQQNTVGNLLPTNIYRH